MKCNHNRKQNWNFCPECGTRLIDLKINYSLETARKLYDELDDLGTGNVGLIKEYYESAIEEKESQVLKSVELVIDEMKKDYKSLDWLRTGYVIEMAQKKLHEY